MRPLATAAMQLGSAHVGECRRGSRVRGGAGRREAGGSVQRVARTLCKCKCCLAVTPHCALEHGSLGRKVDAEVSLHAN